MPEMTIFAYFALFIQFIIGVMGLIKPKKTAAWVGIQAINLPGKAEIRAVFGGYLLGGALAGFYLQSPSYCYGLGIAWLFAAFARIVAIFADKAAVKENYAGILIECIIGIFLII